MTVEIQNHMKGPCAVVAILVIGGRFIPNANMAAPNLPFAPKYAKNGAYSIVQIG
jgi:hypothetical protein